MRDPVEVTYQRPLPPAIGVYSASTITLYGVQLNSVQTYYGFQFSLTYVSFSLTGNTVLVPALIFGYDYQGHFYNMPEPMIMVVDPSTRQTPPTGTNGFPNGYATWTADQKALTAQLHVTNDSFENLILKKNLPGPKQPGSYNAMIIMSHRGGSLVE